MKLDPIVYSNPLMFPVLLLRLALSTVGVVFGSARMIYFVALLGPLNCFFRKDLFPDDKTTHSI